MSMACRHKIKITRTLIMVLLVDPLNHHAHAISTPTYCYTIISLQGATDYADVYFANKLKQAITCCCTATAARLQMM